MARWNGTGKAVILWISLFALSGAALGAQGSGGQANGDPMAIIPAESLFCVRINNLSGTLGKLDQFLTGISPVGTSMLVPAQLAKLLGSTEAKGVNMAGNFAVFGPLPGGDKPDPKRVGVLIPVSDYQQFVEGNPRVAPPDAQGISTIGEDPMTFSATQAGGYALVTATTNRQALIEMKNLLAGPGATPLAKRLSPEEMKRATGSPVWAYANIQVASRVFEPMIKEKLQDARKGLEAAKAQGVPMLVDANEVISMYATLLNTLMKETQFVSLSLEPSASVLRATSVTAAMPNTEMAKILSMDGSQGQQPNLFGYLQNGAMMNFVTSLSPAFSKAITAKYADLLASLMGETASKEDVAKLRQIMTESADIMGGDAAFSFSPALGSKPPFAFRYVATIKDKQRFYQFLEQASQLAKEGVIADFYEKLGLKIGFDLKRSVSTYKDVAIDAIHFTMQPVDANSPQGQMITAMLGDGFDLRLATVENLLLYTMSATPDKEIQALIDQAKAGGSTQVASEVQAALDLLPEAKKAEFFMTYNYLRVLQMATAMMPIPIPKADVPTESNIALTAQVGDGKLQMDAAVPKQHVLEVITVFMKMQQEHMKQQQEQQPPTPPQEQTPQAQPQSRPLGRT